jgi:GntR family transcriptional regulator
LQFVFPFVNIVDTVYTQTVRPGVKRRRRGAGICFNAFNRHDEVVTMSTNPILQASLSYESNIPLYFQLVGIIKRNIAAHILSPGDMLPSETELCKSLSISRTTVRLAIGSLVEEGLVVRRQGLGSFVAEPKVRRKSENVYSFTSEITAMGLPPSSTILEFDVIKPTPDIVEMLELHSDQIPVYRFTRIRRVNNEPLMLETSFYPQYIYPHLTRELLETHSFYSLLFETGLVPDSAIDSYDAVKLSHDEAHLLGCKSGSAAFFHQRRTRTEQGEFFEFTQSLIRGDRVRLDVVLQRNGVSFSRSVDKDKEKDKEQATPSVPVAPSQS